jgi:hypothetical protein
MIDTDQIFIIFQTTIMELQNAAMNGEVKQESRLQCGLK